MSEANHLVSADGTVRLWPYARGVYPRDTLYRVWAMIEKENGHRRLFYAQACEHQGERGDLESFCAQFLGKLVFLVEIGLGRIAGLIWFDQVQHQTAHINVWSSKAAFGAPFRQAVHLSLGHVRQAFGWQRVWAYTPWPEAKKLALDCGFKLEATLVDRVCIEGVWRPLFILRRELEG